MSEAAAPRAGPRITVREADPSDAAAITRLNDRFRAAGVHHVVYGSHQVPVPADGPIRERLYVAVDDDEVRGAVWLREHLFHVAGRDVTMGWPKYLVGESLIDGRFSGVPRSLLAHCVRLQPLLLGLGYGGHQAPLPRMLGLLGWRGLTVPFLFRVLRAGPALRELAAIRTTPARRFAADVLRVTGVGSIGVTVASAAIGLVRVVSGRGLQAEEVATFGPWTDSVWSRCANAYGFLSIRDARMLAALYPSGSSPDLVRLRFRRNGEERGWAVLVRHDFSVGAPDRNFGRMVVGVFADALALPEDADAVASAAMDWFAASGVDLVFSNQSHPAWIRALRKAGFLPGPVNYAFYSAGATQKVLDEPAVIERGLHLTRGDGDGPIWYQGASASPVG